MSRKACDSYVGCWVFMGATVRRQNAVPDGRRKASECYFGCARLTVADAKVWNASFGVDVQWRRRGNEFEIWQVTTAAEL